MKLAFIKNKKMYWKNGEKVITDFVVFKATIEVMGISSKIFELEGELKEIYIKKFEKEILDDPEYIELIVFKHILELRGLKLAGVGLDELMFE